MIFTDANNTFSTIDEAEPFSRHVPTIKANLTLGEFMHFDEVKVSQDERMCNRMIIGYERNKFKVQLLGHVTEEKLQLNNLGEMCNKKASTFEEICVTKYYCCV